MGDQMDDEEGGVAAVRPLPKVASPTDQKPEDVMADASFLLLQSA
jgi:hypothetical protein